MDDAKETSKSDDECTYSENMESEQGIVNHESEVSSSKKHDDENDELKIDYKNPEFQSQHNSKSERHFETLKEPESLSQRISKKHFDSFISNNLFRERRCSDEDSDDESDAESSDSDYEKQFPRSCQKFNLKAIEEISCQKSNLKAIEEIINKMNKSLDLKAHRSKRPRSCSNISERGSTSQEKFDVIDYNSSHVDKPHSSDRISLLPGPSNQDVSEVVKEFRRYYKSFAEKISAGCSNYRFTHISNLSYPSNHNLHGLNELPTPNASDITNYDVRVIRPLPESEIFGSLGSHKVHGTREASSLDSFSWANQRENTSPIIESPGPSNQKRARNVDVSPSLEMHGSLKRHVQRAKKSPDILKLINSNSSSDEDQRTNSFRRKRRRKRSKCTQFYSSDKRVIKTNSELFKMASEDESLDFAADLKRHDGVDSLNFSESDASKESEGSSSSREHLNSESSTTVQRSRKRVGSHSKTPAFEGLNTMCKKPKRSDSL